MFEYEYCQANTDHNENDLKYLEYCELLMQAKELGMGYRIEWEGTLYCVPTPIVSIDESNAFHSLIGPSIRWIGGSEFYHLWGVSFGKPLWEKVTNPDVDVKDILKIENIDQRTAALRLVGPEKLLDAVKAEHLATSDRGNGLYKIPSDGTTFPEDFYLLKYKDIKTPRIYVAFVPLNADDMGTDGLDPVQKELFEAHWRGKPVAASGDPDSCMAFRHLMTKEEYASLTNET